MSWFWNSVLNSPKFQRKKKMSTFIFAFYWLTSQESHGFLGPCSIHFRTIYVVLHLFSHSSLHLCLLLLLPGVGERGRVFPVSASRLMVWDYLTRVYRRYCLLSLWKMLLLSVAWFLKAGKGQALLGADNLLLFCSTPLAWITGWYTATYG